MKRLLLLLLLSCSLAGCAGLAPVEGERTVYVYSPYAPASQPNPMAFELGPQTQTAEAPPPPPVLPPVNPGLPPPRTREVSGPATVCKDGLVVEVRAGERVHESNASLYLSGADVDLMAEAWSYELPRDSRFLRAAGAVEAPGLGRLERFEIIGSGSAEPRFTYVLDNSPRALFARWGVRSDRFDGGPADLDILSRIRRQLGDASSCSRMG